MTDLAAFLGLHRHEDADASRDQNFDMRPKEWEFDIAAA